MVGEELAQPRQQPVRGEDRHRDTRTGGCRRTAAPARGEITEGMAGRGGKCGAGRRQHDATRPRSNSLAPSVRSSPAMRWLTATP